MMLLSPSFSSILGSVMSLDIFIKFPALWGGKYEILRLTSSLTTDMRFEVTFLVNIFESRFTMN